MAKRFQTLAALGLMKTILLLFNTAFWVSGVFLLAVGLWMELELQKYMELSTFFATTIPFIFVSLGGAILLLAVLACCCTAKGKVPLLYIYSSFLVMIFVGETSLLFCGYFYREELTAGFHNGLSRGLQFYGKEATQSAAVDDIQSTLKCCGLTNYTDWQATPWGKGHPNKLPHSCCQTTTEAVCYDNKEKASLYRIGCYRLIVNFILENLTKFGIGILIIAVVHLFGIVLTCLLAKTISKSTYQEIS